MSIVRPIEACWLLRDHEIQVPQKHLDVVGIGAPLGACRVAINDVRLVRVHQDDHGSSWNDLPTCVADAEQSDDDG